MVQNGTSSKNAFFEHFANTNHPVCGAKEATRHFIEAAATPLYQEGNSQPDTHYTFINRASSRFAITWTVSVFYKPDFILFA